MNTRIEKIKEKWDALSERWNDFRNEQIITKIIDNPYSVFRPQLQVMLKQCTDNFKGKRVLIPASGDNRAVFAFYLLGATVTSSDISEKQLECSAMIAKKHNWDIEFICDDVMNLTNFKSNEYDLVYISNGVMVWINDLDSMYRNIYRVLKTDGCYMMYDMHPFMWPFDIDDTTKLALVKDYDATGPFGNISTFQWRLQDIINAIISSGLILEHMEEMHAEHGTFWVDEDKASCTPEDELSRWYDSKTNPLYALPQSISLSARKKRTV